MNANPKKIIVVAHARLHMGFIDLSGSLDRQFGSIGLALNEIFTRLSLQAAEQLHVRGTSANRAQQCTQELCRQLDVSDQLSINIEQAIPEHIGLGSGTQMALAIGMALNQFYQLDHSVRDIASLSERGKRSGIGIGVFELGGLVVDGGRGINTITPPVIAQMSVPEDWRFILVFDQRGQGLHGNQELDAFKKLPPFSEHEATRLCYLLMRQALPGVAENNIEQFGHVISHLQKSVGKHFAPAQGGIFTSQAVEQVINFFSEQGAVAIGQTSWGPTGFCALVGEAEAHALVNLAQQQFQHLNTLSYQITRAQNCGSEIVCQ